MVLGRSRVQRGVLVFLILVVLCTAEKCIDSASAGWVRESEVQEGKALKGSEIQERIGLQWVETFHWCERIHRRNKTSK
jgi:hypothetical protein